MSDNLVSGGLLTGPKGSLCAPAPAARPMHVAWPSDKDRLSFSDFGGRGLGVASAFNVRRLESPERTA
jgi:hypothetical protein